MCYSCSCHMFQDMHCTGQPECPPWFALVVCLVEGGGGCFCVFCVFLGEGATRGWAKGDKGRDDMIFVSGSIVASFECPTSMRRL